MIEVIAVHGRGAHGGVMPARAEIELLQTACRFFADRLLSRKQQNRITLFVEFTAAPWQAPVSTDQLVGDDGFLGFRPPRLFEMKVSSAAGMRAAFLHVATEMVLVAQVTSGRLKIVTRKRRLTGARQVALMARWAGGREGFFDALPPEQRPWAAEANAIARQLLEQFLTWALGDVEGLAGQAATARQIRLYPVGPATVIMPDKIRPMARQIKQRPTQPPAVDTPDDMPPDIAMALAAETRLNDAVPGSRTTAPVVAAGAVPDQPPACGGAIYVQVPHLGTTRRLDSAVLQGKVNDLLERGLVQRNAARTALAAAARQNDALIRR
jgi:hypothetical protein